MRGWQVGNGRLMFDGWRSRWNSRLSRRFDLLNTCVTNPDSLEGLAIQGLEGNNIRGVKHAKTGVSLAGDTVSTPQQRGRRNLAKGEHVLHESDVHRNR